MQLEPEKVEAYDMVAVESGVERIVVDEAEAEETEVDTRAVMVTGIVYALTLSATVPTVV